LGKLNARSLAQLATRAYGGSNPVDPTDLFSFRNAEATVLVFICEGVIVRFLAMIDWMGKVGSLALFSDCRCHIFGVC